ncbi:MAG TPA: MFS transporter [Candidatus Binataceae bacterium]|nr:MFS transporter [Candidatus Binataceae bacterium]
MSVADLANDRSARSVTRRYYVVWGSHMAGSSFIAGIYPLFLAARGLDQLQINLVIAVYLAVCLLTDVPTGAFADVIGRRASVVLGCALHMAGYILYYKSYSYWHFIAAETLDALGKTFANGPIDAWLVDALSEAGAGDRLRTVFSRRSQIWRAASMSGAVVGAYAARGSLATPFLLSAIAWAVAGLVAFTLMDAGKRSRRAPSIGAELRRRTIESTRAGFNDRGVLMLSSAVMIFSMAWAPWRWEWQRSLSAGMGVEIVGWLWVAFSLAHMLGAETVVWSKVAWRARARWITGCVMVESAAFLLSGFFPMRIALVCALFVIANVASGAIEPVHLTWFNEMIEGENRATLLSFQSTFGTIGGIFGLPLQGEIVDRLGAGLAWQTIGLLSLLQMPFYLALRGSRPTPNRPGTEAHASL